MDGFRSVLENELVLENSAGTVTPKVTLKIDLVIFYSFSWLESDALLADHFNLISLLLIALVVSVPTFSGGVVWDLLTEALSRNH